MSFKIKLVLMIFIIASISILIFQITNPKLLTNDRKNIVKIEITLNPYLNAYTFTVESQQSIERIYTVLKETYDMEINRYPGHSEGDHTDGKIYLKIFYRDGTNDFLKTGENQYFIYRSLETRGSSGDNGYIGGSNDELWNYLNKIKVNYSNSSLETAHD